MSLLLLFRRVFGGASNPLILRGGAAISSVFGVSDALRDHVAGAMAISTTMAQEDAAIDAVSGIAGISATLTGSVYVYE